MTMSKWSMPILVLVLLSLASLIGCGGQPAPEPPLALSPSSAPPPSSPSPSSASEITVVSTLSGEVLVMKAGTETWSKASAGMTLEPDDRIKTGADSKAVITFFEGSTVELEADTEIGVTELNIAEDTGSTTIKLWQEIGKTRSRVEKLIDPASRYEIETPAGAAVVRGSEGVTEVDEVGNMTFYVVVGEWLVCAQGECLSVGAGQKAYVALGEPPTLVPPPPPPPVDGGGVGRLPLTLWRVWIQTTVNDFSAGTTDNMTVIDIGGGDGTVMLACDPSVELLDQENRSYSDNMTHSIYGTEYQAQTFRAGITGSLSKVALRLEKVGRPPQPLVVELRNCVMTGKGIEPGNTVYASVSTDNIGRADEYPFSFAIRHTVVSGTNYSLVLYQRGNSGNVTNCYKWSEDTDNHYRNGMVWQSHVGGITWHKGAEGMHDFYFATYVNGHYLSGTLESSSYDCGGSADFGTISWDNAISPGVTELKFQIATNNNNTIWNFVGPSGASNTYYTTNGTNIWSGHDGGRYIKYKAYLRTSDLGQTPELKQIWITYR